MGNKQTSSQRNRAESQNVGSQNQDNSIDRVNYELDEYKNTSEASDKSVENKEVPNKSGNEKHKVCDENPSKPSPQETSVALYAPPDPAFYYLKLYCVSDHKKSRNVTVYIDKPPKTVRDIKLHIQKEFSIPDCCQCVSFESHRLKDHHSLAELRIREGDTLVVHYTADAMVEELTDIIRSIGEMECFLSGEIIETQLSYGYHDSELDSEMSKNLNAFKVESLATAYFHPSSDPTCQANRYFFVKNGGLEKMHSLHKELLKYPWSDCHIEMQYLEHAILRVLWNISAAFSIRMLLFKRPTMDAVMKSLVRVNIPADRKIEGPMRNFESTRITCEMVYKAVGTICNFADIPECRLKIASNKAVLDQLLATLTCPSYAYIASLVAGAGLLCLAYSPETHQYLITDNVIQKMEKACRSYKYQSLMDVELLKYFRSMFYAELLYASAKNIPLVLKRKMYNAIHQFLKSADYNKIRLHEKKNGYIWSTVTPVLKLVYLPKNSPTWTFHTHNSSDSECDVNKEMAELKDLCIESGVFSLQNMLLCDETRELVNAEHVLDFVVCMPWHLTDGTNAHARACNLRKFLGNKMQIQPPSLVNMAKAKLAMMHFGLERVINASSVHEIVNEIIQ